MNLLLIVLGSLAIVTRAQRPLNTTTNLTSVFTGPFFVMPTAQSVPTKLPLGPGGPRNGGAFYSNTNRESTGIRNNNRDRLPPPHSNSHLDIFTPALSSVGGQLQQPAQTNPVPINRLQSVKNIRKNSLNVIRDLVKNGNQTHIHGRKVNNPEKLFSTREEIDKRPSSEGSFVEKVKIMRPEISHTPSTPAYNIDDVDGGEKLGIKCTFEKPCAWTYDTVNVTGSNFEVTTGIQLKEANLTGLYWF